MARKRSDFPTVPVLLVGGALAGLIYLGTRKKAPAAPDRQSVPVGTPNGMESGPGTRIRAGNRFIADLSSSLVSSNPAVRAPGAIFIANEDYSGAGLMQQGFSSITSRHEATGEIVPVPVKFITAVIG